MSTINRSEHHNLKGPKRALSYPNDLSPHYVWFFTASNRARKVRKTACNRDIDGGLAALDDALDRADVGLQCGVHE